MTIGLGSYPLIPTFDSCLVCEAIRPELNGKLILLGFFGICPNVVVALQHLDQPAVLSFVLSGAEGDGSFMTALEIIDESNQTTIATATPWRAIATPNTPTHLLATHFPTFGHEGVFSLRCVLDGEERFRGLFRVKQGPSV